jgi:tetratricopeptide (TPR) repeat protein
MMPSWIPTWRSPSRALFVLLALALPGCAWIGCAQNPVQRRDSYFQRGQKYFQEKKYADAAIEFANAVKIDPRFAQGYYYLGLSDKNRNDLQSAFQDFSKEMEVDPKQTPGALELANLYLMGNQPEQAQQIAGDVLRRDPRNFSALLIVAQSYLGEKKYAQALQGLKKLKAMRPSEAPIYFAIGIAQIGNRDLPGAESSFRSGIQLDPASPEGYRNLANLYRKMGRPSSAEQTLQQGLRATGSAPELHFMLADLYCQWGRLADAQATLLSLEKKDKPTADLYSTIGDFWVAHNQLQSALDEYQNAYALAPSLLLKKKFANVYITLDNVPEAEWWSQEILKTNPKDRDGNLFAGAIAHLRGHDPAAVEQLRKALENDSKSVFGHYYLGVALMAMGKDDEAKSQFFDCLKTDPTFSYAFLRLAQLSLRAKDAQGAKQYAREVMQQNPTILDGYLVAADAAILSGDTARAEQALLLANHFAPDSPVVTLRQAVLDGLGKNYAKAETEYQSVLTKVKDPTPILAGLAQIYVQQNQTAIAIQKVSSYASGPEANAGLFVLLAQLHLLQNDLSAANTDCQQALRLDGKNARAYFYLGRIADLKGNDNAAVENYARAGQLNQTDGLPDLLAGDLSGKLGHWPEANKYYQLALQQSPGMARAQAGLAWTMIELGEDSNVALGLAQQARSSAPSDPVVADALGWVYVKKGLPQLAIPLLRQAVEKMPDEASFSFHLGMAYSGAGEKAEARRALLDARKLGLSEPEAKQTEQTLALLSAPSKAR